jgi:ketosteroid isomerase-like protein
MRRATLAMVVVTALASAAPVAAQQAGTSMKPRINAGVDQVRRNYQDWFNKGNIRAAAGLFHPDAIYINADGSVTTGRANIEKLLDAGPKGMVAIEPIYESDPSGNFAWATGWSKQRMVTNGKEWDQVAKWLVVLEQSGGKWWIRSIALVPQAPGS